MFFLLFDTTCDLSRTNWFLYPNHPWSITLDLVKYTQHPRSHKPPNFAPPHTIIVIIQILNYCLYTQKIHSKFISCHKSITFKLSMWVLCDVNNLAYALNKIDNTYFIIWFISSNTLEIKIKWVQCLSFIIWSMIMMPMLCIPMDHWT